MFKEFFFYFTFDGNANGIIMFARSVKGQPKIFLARKAKNRLFLLNLILFTLRTSNMRSEKVKKNVLFNLSNRNLVIFRVFHPQFHFI